MTPSVCTPYLAEQDSRGVQVAVIRLEAGLLPHILDAKPSPLIRLLQDGGCVLRLQGNLVEVPERCLMVLYLDMLR